MLGAYASARIYGGVLSRAEVQRFMTLQARSPEGAARLGMRTQSPDFSLWAEKRIKQYQESLAASFSPAVAVLRIPKIHLEVPVLQGTDDLTLNRAVGLIAGTALPGEDGNLGIAGHRDGFFRGLKDLRIGDPIELVTQTKTNTYIIDRIVIVDPSDVSVLARRPRTSVTLVTCHPFYFVGSAPQRYIVQASLLTAVPAMSNCQQPARRVGLSLATYTRRITMKTSDRLIRLLSILAVLAVSLAFTLSMNAQVQTETTTTMGKPTHEVQVDRAEVVAVSGDDLVLKMEDGSTRDVSVPAGATVTVDGNKIGIRDVKPGMKLSSVRWSPTRRNSQSHHNRANRNRQSVVRESSKRSHSDAGGRDRSANSRFPKDQMFLVKQSPGDQGRMVRRFRLEEGECQSALRRLPRNP